MSDLFSNLIDRASGELTQAAPLLPSRFAPVVSLGDTGWGEIQEEVSVRPTPASGFGRVETRRSGNENAAEPVRPASPPPIGSLVRSVEAAPRTNVERVEGEAARQEQPRQRPSAAMPATIVERLIASPPPARRVAEKAAAPAIREQVRTGAAVPAEKPDRERIPVSRPAPEAPAREERALRQPMVQIKIGRIEVKAPQAPAPRAPAMPRTPAGPRVSLTLRDYLSNQGRR